MGCSGTKSFNIIFFVEKLFHPTLSAILSKKHCLFPKPSAERQTLSPVPVQDKHTMSSCKLEFSEERDYILQNFRVRLNFVADLWETLIVGRLLVILTFLDFIIINARSGNWACEQFCYKLRIYERSLVPAFCAIYQFIQGVPRNLTHFVFGF